MPVRALPEAEPVTRSCLGCLVSMWRAKAGADAISCFSAPAPSRRSKCCASCMTQWISAVTFPRIETASFGLDLSHHPA